MNMSPLAVFLAATTLALAGCGGSGGGGTPLAVQLPPPPPPPAPPPPPVSIFPDKTTQQYTAINVPGASPRLDIRYDAGRSVYEVSLDNGAWNALALDPADPNRTGYNLAFSANGRTYRLNLTDINGNNGFRYSDLAYFQPVDALQGSGNVAAFGIATPDAAVPVTGTARYAATIYGTTNVPDTSAWGPGYWNLFGAMTLDFDFAKGTLGGSVAPVLSLWIDTPLTPLTFTDTVVGAGNSGFSGRFATDLAGTNGFAGRFAGPNATEVMGQFAFPFMTDGKIYQGQGGFIGKQ